MAQVVNIIGSICDATDTSKTFSVGLSGATTGTKATLLFSQTANANYTFPSNSATLMASDGGQTVTSGTWNGSLIGPVYGGTGVNNGSSTITLGGNLVTSGAFPITLTASGSTNVTLPTTGTLITNAVTTLGSLTSASSLATVGTITSGTWNAGVISPTYGGTGVNNGSNTITLGGNLSTGGALAISNSATIGSVLSATGAGTASWTALSSLGVTSITGTASQITASSSTGAITLSLPNPINVNTTGSAATLTTARTINGVSFNGSANITVTADASTLTGITLNSTVVSSSLTSVGTITSGTWNATAIGATRGGTGQTTWTTGDLLYASAANTLSKLPVGASGNVLTVSAGLPAWVAPSSSSSTGINVVPTSGAAFESNSNAYLRVGTFIYNGTSSTDGTISKIVVLAYTTTTQTYHAWRIYNATNATIIATSAPLNTGTSTAPVVVNLGTISNLPVGPAANAVFEVQLLATNSSGNTGVTNRQNIGIFNAQVYF